MLRVSILLYLFIFSCLVVAQDTKSPAKTKNSDLRSVREILSIKYPENKTFEKLYVSTTSGGQFHLQHQVNDKIVKSIKIDSANAQSIDDQFVDKFITMKYMMEKKYKDKCSDYLFLIMRGEELKVCVKDSQRVSIVGELIKLLKSNLI